ncbi:MAG TPA: RNA polymerase sigma factor [Candidatus Acidoferrum sp.]|nr:RNA polymerase sigma factor [Candidatus Acidoferrum sp.]
MIGNNYSYARALCGHTGDSERGGFQTNTMPEAEAIRRSQRGDAAAFERLYRLYSKRIYALCLRMVGNTTEAEDLTQEAFLKVFRKIHTFRGESAFSTWLHRLVVNVVLMQLRRKNLLKATLEDAFEPDRENGRAGKELGGPDVSLIGLIDRVNLERAVAQLPSGSKTVFVLHDMQGYKHHEIAEMLNWSVGTSKGQLHRAHRRLRELLQESRRCVEIGPGAFHQNGWCPSSY